MNFSGMSISQLDAEYANAQNAANHWLAQGNAQAAHDAHKVMQAIVAARDALVSGGGGGGGGGKSQEQIAREIAAEQAAVAAESRRRNVFDDAKAMIESWGIETSGGFMNQLRDWVWKDYSNDRVMMEFRKSATYNNRFTGMKDLAARGQFMNEQQYIALERDYRNTMAQWDLPTGFYDSYDDFGRFIANGVSVKELDDRITSAKTILDQDTDPNYKKALMQLGAGEGDLLAYVIDGDKAQSMVQKKLRTAALAGTAMGTDAFEDMNANDLDRYAAALGAEYDNISAEEMAQLQRRVGATANIAERDSFLSSLENDTTFQKADLLDAEFLGDMDKTMASQRRAERERGRFQGVSGVGKNALGSRRSI